jgi:hypothetical protein
MGLEIRIGSLSGTEPVLSGAACLWQSYAFTLLLYSGFFGFLLGLLALFGVIPLNLIVFCLHLIVAFLSY